MISIPYPQTDSVRVESIMSHGLQTVDASARLRSVIGRMRRIGHEGFPVVSEGRIVGLLTRRDADRAAEHGLIDLQVRDLMLVGEVTVTLSDTLAEVVKRMVETGWWQIPVVDERGHPIGIVTRTDVLKHWAFAATGEQQQIGLEQIEHVLGSPITRLIALVLQQAQAHNSTLYLVGGIVRDLLLGLRSTDIDFVVRPADPNTEFGEAARALASQLTAAHGGQVHVFRPFGTAKWILARSFIEKLGFSSADEIDHIDFASARAEYYEHPAALPTVYTSSLKLDLERRDFTINALAIQFEREDAPGILVDYFGGVRDLKNGHLRVMHSLSFVDDPTRLLRAARFEARFGFKLEPRTFELMQVANPMLARTGGERIRNELSLLLRERDPARGLRILEARGQLQAIHAAFSLPPDLEDLFEAARQVAPHPIETLFWHLLSSAIPATQLGDWCQRLMIGKSLCESFQALHQLLHARARLNLKVDTPSRLARWLDDFPEVVITAARTLLRSDSTAAECLQQYIAIWEPMRHRLPLTTGQTLKARGLKPGPCFGIIRSRLLDAWRDGVLHSAADEHALLETLLA
ncbi:MAG: CBS domain-containing protein, partial [Anaerolinea sp.]|nr:CBS domain-containing protein [Anaerolinea sp.]